MLSVASWLVAGHLLTSPLHPIDFQLTQAPQARPSNPAAMSAGTSLDDQDEANALPRFSIAHGFGNGVPLTFAVKQVVPSMFRVIYRNGVDQNQLTSWVGNRPWNQALGTALRQHGLRMVLIGRTVTIGY